MKDGRATTTLGDLQRTAGWVWVHCAKRNHATPLKLEVPIKRWGITASSDVLRQQARCAACGNKGATLQLPGWSSMATGFMPYPGDK
jgi:hypothetical protein